MADVPREAVAPSGAPAMGWWMALLVASLALNLLVAGALAVRFFAPEHFERFTGANYSPLIPRKFLSDLPAGATSDWAALRPDLVIIQTNPTRLRERLSALKLPVLEIKQDSIPALYESIQQVGAATGAGVPAAGLVPGV